MNELRLFPDDGELRPPGLHQSIRPTPGLRFCCPTCKHFTLEYPTLTHAYCECGYEWTRSGQLHHTEPIPY